MDWIGRPDWQLEPFHHNSPTHDLQSAELPLRLVRNLILALTFSRFVLASVDESLAYCNQCSTLCQVIWPSKITQLSLFSQNNPLMVSARLPKSLRVAFFSPGRGTLDGFGCIFFSHFWHSWEANVTPPVSGTYAETRHKKKHGGNVM